MLYKVMYKLLTVLFLNWTPSICLHIKMYSEAKILHFYLLKEIGTAAISCTSRFLKNAKHSRKDHKNPGSTYDKRQFPHAPFTMTCLHTHPKWTYYRIYWKPYINLNYTRNKYHFNKNHSRFSAFTQFRVYNTRVVSTFILNSNFCDKVFKK